MSDRTQPNPAYPFRMEAIGEAALPPSVYSPGSRASGFFSSLSRGFSIHHQNVLDHWRGLADNSPTITEEEQLEVYEGRNIKVEPGLTQEQAARRVEQHDRMARERQFESNVRSAVGHFVGGTVPWLYAPESIAALPFGGIGVGARAALSAGRVGAGMAAVRGAGYQIPTGVVMGGTNIISQQAAYGNVDALEAALVFAAPSVLGGAIDAARAGRGLSRARAAERNENGLQARTRDAQVSPPAPRAVDVPPGQAGNVPPRFQNEFARWAGIRSGMSTQEGIDTVVAAVLRDRADPSLTEQLIEGFVRTGTAEVSNVTPQLRQMRQRLNELDRQAGEVSAGRSLPARPVEERRALQARLAEAENAAQEAAVRGNQNTSGLWMERANTLRQELAEADAVPFADPADALARIDAERRQLMRDMAGELARTPHAVPAEVAAEVLEGVMYSRMQPRSAVRRPSVAEEPLPASADMPVTPVQASTDPEVQALLKMPGGKQAAELYERGTRILEGCAA